MKYSFLICSIALLISYFRVNAQEKTEFENSELIENTIELLKLNQLEHEEILNFSLTKQVGNNNDIQILSDPQSAFNHNLIAVVQFGNQNSGIINQNGNNQGIGVFQKGNQNEANLFIKGDNIFSVVTQVGYKNYVSHDIDNGSNSSYKKVISEQIGNENRIILQSGVVDYSLIEIRQNGNNNNAELNLTNTGLPTESYQIEQTGNNADIVITKSDFYMPMKSNK